MYQKVRRLLVEKRHELNIEARALLEELQDLLSIKKLNKLRLLNRYDLQNISDLAYEKAKNFVLTSPNTDYVYEETIEEDYDYAFALELLPGQYDIWEDYASQSIEVISLEQRPIVSASKLYLLYGDLSEDDIQKIKDYIINPIEKREVPLKKVSCIEQKYHELGPIETLNNFIEISDDEIKGFRDDNSLAMTLEDLFFTRDYFRDQEKRDPTITEIKLIDTYWSDHCRHTTFNTKLEEISLPKKSPIESTYKDYLAMRDFVYGDRAKDRDINLMDLATIGMKYLKKIGHLDDLDESDEINACSIKIKAKIDGKDCDYLIMFKNETHNHPTEIEPFGGASTCLGGAIRDPLSGRSYVYQAMRITGAWDPNTPIDKTLPGKLPQRTITLSASDGYSSYGNQIGLAAGKVEEIYHPGYVAKRMELGAVIACAPSKNVVRQKPVEGDLIILLGGRTGRDGIGGATGSSKEHTEESSVESSSEVQKGNAPLERKIQRLFRKEKVTRLIKKCNDFGAGGVSVAIGELADSLLIDLDKVPVKYPGLDGTELAISESQERMAVVVAKEDANLFIEYANEEALEASIVAKVTDNRRLQLRWKGQTIVDISRDFLDTNGLIQKAKAKVEDFDFSFEKKKVEDIKGEWFRLLSNLNVASQKGLIEKFDSTAGGNTVLMPLGGKYQLTEADGMVARLPLEEGNTNFASIMTHGFDPYLSEANPFYGGLYAVVDSLARVTALGGNYEKTRLSFQEFFEKLQDDPIKWGKPLSALLGALHVQKSLHIPSIGGKDSMSGSFMDLDVPPTLVSFAVNIVEDYKKIISQEFKKANSRVYLYELPRDDKAMPDFDSLKDKYKRIYDLSKEGKIHAAMALKFGGLAETISKMAFGNKIGLKFERAYPLFDKMYGSLVFETDEDLGDEFILLGRTICDKIVLVNGLELPIDELIESWRNTLDHVFKTYANKDDRQFNIPQYEMKAKVYGGIKVARPRVFLPLFPGTSSEYETIRAFTKAGADVETLVFNNLSLKDIEKTIDLMRKSIDKANILVFAGGQSGGGEPDGSGKFILSAFKNQYLSESVDSLLKERDGLVLGIGDGFHALVRLGLIESGQAALTDNSLGRHISSLVRTRIVSNKSPWLWKADMNQVYRQALSTSQGRFFASEETIRQMIENGQVASVYVDLEARPSMDPKWNLCASMYAIEGLTSKDGRVLGKMTHPERIDGSLCKNVPGPSDLDIFKAGVEYFTK